MSQHAAPTLARELKQGTVAQKVDALFGYMEKKGQSYYDEAVTQLEHALQCANQARLAKADAITTTAALLHDLGHFLVDEHNEESDFLSEDFLHETVGADYLEPFFPSAVIEPVKLHVPAKRYICTTDAMYYDTLSKASKHSFQLQGGFMSESERTAFEQNECFRAAVQVRKWDDLAKVTNLAIPGLPEYRDAVASCLTMNDPD